MSNICLCFIKRSYFIEHQHFRNMLDPCNFEKQSQRTHLCILVNINENHILIPLRNNLGPPLRKYGKIGFAVPSQKRPHAGLDYRYSLIINNSDYLEYQTKLRLPNSQYQIITQNYDVIKREITTYLNRYIKVARKNRIHKEPLFRNSSLINFHNELKV